MQTSPNSIRNPQGDPSSRPGVVRRSGDSQCVSQTADGPTARRHPGHRHTRQSNGDRRLPVAKAMNMAENAAPEMNVRLRAGRRAAVKNRDTTDGRSFVPSSQRSTTQWRPPSRKQVPQRRHTSLPADLPKSNGCDAPGMRCATCCSANSRSASAPLRSSSGWACPIAPRPCATKRAWSHAMLLLLLATRDDFGSGRARRRRPGNPAREPIPPAHWRARASQNERPYSIPAARATTLSPPRGRTRAPPLIYAWVLRSQHQGAMVQVHPGSVQCVFAPNARRNVHDH